MKKIMLVICILVFAQLVFAVKYPPSKDSLIKEFGKNYYDLRIQLPYDDAGYFFYDEAQRKKDECLAILMKLLNDKTITAKKISLFESLNVNSSNTVIEENDFIINAIIRLSIIGNGYRSFSEAISDNFKKFPVKDKILIMTMTEKRNIYYSIVYQRDFAMPKNCSDILAKYNYDADNISKELNEEALKEYEKSIDGGCIFIGILSHYVDAVIEEGKYKKTQLESNTKAIEIYNKFFDKLSERDLNTQTTLNLFQKLTYLDKGKDNDRIQSGINKKIAKLISDDKIKLKDQPQWVRKGYLRLLTNSVKTKKMIQKLNSSASIDAVTDANNTEAVNILKNVFKKKGNVFVLSNDKKSDYYEELTKGEKEFLMMIEN